MADSRLPNFRALTPAQRLAAIADAASLTPEERQLLAQPGALGLDRADGSSTAIGTSTSRPLTWKLSLIHI